MRTIQTTNNHNELQSRFKDIYNSLFYKCQIVASAPASFILAGDITMRTGGISISQKAPLRTYIGIEIAENEKGISIASDQKFNIQKNTFEAHNPENIHRSIQTSREFEKCVYELYPSLNNKKISLHIITEHQPQQGFGAFCAFGAALALALSQLNELSEQNKQILSLGEKERIILENAVKFASIKKNILISVPQTTCSLLSSPYPIISAYKLENDQFSQKFMSSNAWSDLREIKIGNIIAQSLDQIMTEVNRASVARASFDYCIFFTGTLTNAHKMFAELKKNVDKTENTLQKLTAKKQSDENNPYMRYVPQSIWAQFSLLSNTIALQFADSLWNSMINFNSQTLETAIQLFNKNQQIMSLSGATSEEQRDIMSEIKKIIIKTTGAKNIGIKTTVNGAGGNILCVSEGFTLRPHIDEILHLIKEKTGIALFPVYLSWRDGFEQNGALIEQNLLKGTISDSIQMPSLIKETWQTPQKKYAVFIERNDAKRHEGKIVIDAINETVYCNGIKATSKELPSQKKIVELILAIIKTNNWSISNKNLPRSSYSAYRNELHGKIVSPLNKFILKNTGIDFPLKIEGKLTDFHISLSTTDFPIIIIRSK